MLPVGALISKSKEVPHHVLRELAQAFSVITPSQKVASMCSKLA